MRSIEVDEAVWAELQRRAEPLVDTVNDVMRQVLGLPREGPVQMSAPSAAPKRRNGRVNGTPEIAFRLPILEVLVCLGGRARRAQVLDGVGELMRGTLKPVDLDLLDSGADKRWRNYASFQRKHMIEVGLLSASSPNGIWEITDAGREYLARAQDGKSV